MARKGSENGTKPPRYGQPFYVPADVRASGSDPEIIGRMRREHYILGRHKPGKRKSS